MNYFNLMDNLLSEIRQFNQYKRFATAYRILLIICMIPVALVGLGIFVSYEVLAFIHKGLATPTSVLQGFVKNEKNDVKHLTQAVIYFITLPWIFTCQVLLSFISFIFYFIWFFFMVTAYLVTLGGIRWQPFITDATFEDNCKYDYHPSLNTVTAYTASTTISLFLVIVSKICLNNEYNESLYTFYTIFTIIYLILVCIINPLIFKKKPISSTCDDSDAATTKEEPAEAETETVKLEEGTAEIELGEQEINTNSNMFRCIVCDKWINMSICPYCGAHNNKK